MDEHKKLNENAIVDCVVDFLVNKPDGNWHVEKIKEKRGHQHGPDLILTGGSHNGERFIIECKGRSYAKSANSINKEGWLNALGQLITRMNTARTIKSGETKGAVNRAYKYGLGVVLGWRTGCTTAHSSRSSEDIKPIHILCIR